MESGMVGRYQILSELARGGMATVRLALDPCFNCQMAVKILPPQFTHDPMFGVRFDREAQVIASLEHQNIVPVYDYGEQDGQPYLVMRYMARGTGQHLVYRDVEEQVVYGFGTERSFTYMLKWRVGYAALGTFRVRSGGQVAESKFYVQSPNCEP